MLSTPCESVQICTDPEGYSRIVRKLNSHKLVGKKCSTKKTHLLFEVLKKFLCESTQICTDPCRYSRICQKLTIPINYYNVFRVSSSY